MPGNGHGLTQSAHRAFGAPNKVFPLLGVFIMTRNVFRFNKRLIGPVVTTALVVLVAAGPA